MSGIGQLIAIPLDQKSVGPRQDSENPINHHYIRNKEVRNAKFKGGGLANHQSLSRSNEIASSSSPSIKEQHFLNNFPILHLTPPTAASPFNHHCLTITIQSPSSHHNSLQELTRSIHHEDLFHRPYDYASRPASYSSSSG